MEFIPCRLLRNQPGELRRRLAQDGQLVITSEGKPLVLRVSVDPARFEEQALRRNSDSPPVR